MTNAELHHDPVYEKEIDQMIDTRVYCPSCELRDVELCGNCGNCKSCWHPGDEIVYCDDPDFEHQAEVEAKVA